VPWLLAASLLTALMSVAEIVFFSFLGQLVDWLSAADRATFVSDHGSVLFWMGALVLVGFPALVLFQSLFFHQTIFGNYPMLVRWQAHRHMLGQSLSFFQDEFAGRVSQKVTQTALAVRDAVTRMTDVFTYVGVYLTGTLIL